MADVTSATITLLAAASSVTTVVGTRIYPDQLPQGNPRTRSGPAKLPAIRVSLVAGASVHHLTDASALASASVQVDCFALTRTAATSLENIVRLALDRASGTYGGVVFREVLSETRYESYDPPADASDVGAYLAGRTYTIWHTED